MRIGKKDYEQEIAYLKSCGLTQEELEGYIEFFNLTLEIEKEQSGSIRIFNCKKRNK